MRAGMTVAIRPFVMADLIRTHEIDREAFGEDGYSPLVLRQLHDVHRDLFVVAEGPRGVLVGYAVGAITTGGSEAWILALGVARDHRGAGVGTSLTSRQLRALRERGTATVYLTVGPDNEVARRLYEAAGFAVVADVADYMGPGQRRLVMRVDLPSYVK